MRTLCLTLLAVVLLGMGMGTASAQTVVFDPDDSEKAIGIENLSALGQLWTVAFTGSTTAADVYGAFPGDFSPFQDSSTNAEAAVNAVNAVLTDNLVAGIGDEDSPVGLGFYRVGFASEQENDIQSVSFWEGLTGDGTDTTWASPTEADVDSYNLGERPWATFTPNAIPEPGSALLLVLGLVCLGAVARRRKAIA